MEALDNCSSRGNIIFLLRWTDEIYFFSQVSAATLTFTLHRQTTEWMTFTHSLRSDSELICNAVSTTAYATFQDRTFTEALEPRVQHSGLHKSPQRKNINNTRDRKNRHWPSITDVNMAIRQNASARGNPAGVSGGGQRAATQIRMSKSSRWGELEEGLSLISAIVFLTQRAVRRGSLTKPACVDKTMLILTCLWMWLSYYQEGSLRKRWEVLGFECSERSCRDHLQPVAIHPPSTPLGTTPLPVPW